MVDVEAGDGETAEADSQGQGKDGGSGGVGRADDDEEDGLDAEAGAVEQFAHLGGGEGARLAELVGQLAADGHDEGHAKVGEGAQDVRGVDVHLEHLAEVHRLADEQQVEGPGAAEVGHVDSPDRFRGEDREPGRGGEGGRLVADLADGALDVLHLLAAYVRMLRGPLEAQPEPEDVPEEADGAVEVEGSLPAEV